MEKPNQPILIIEDSEEDYQATLRAFYKAGLANPIYRCRTGDEALDFLFIRGGFNDQSAPRPGIILLDLNLPGTDGREVLRMVKQNPHTKNIPVIILTTSSFEGDIQACYAEGASSYVVKPVDLIGFVQAIQRLKDYWFEVVILPRTE
jgi:two-component system response regulator